MLGSATTSPSLDRGRTTRLWTHIVLPALAFWTWLPAARVQFTDITAESGIRFRHFNGAAGEFYFPEIAGPGAAFLDYDRDGDQDVFLVNGSSLPVPNPATDPDSQLYRNDGDGTFTEVTAQSKLDLRGFFGMGAAAGDYDNDGDPDLYVTGYLRSVPAGQQRGRDLPGRHRIGRSPQPGALGHQRGILRL